MRSRRPLLPDVALVEYQRVPSMTAGYVISRAGAAKLQKATTPTPRKAAAATNGHRNGNGEAAAAVAAVVPARGRKPAEKAAKKPRRAPSRAR